jgi:[DsrC]-trisulfide reductase subunit J
VRLLAALALVAALAVPAGVLAGVDKPILEKASKGPCIAPPAVMRREHPEMLLHQRVKTVHQGVVGARVSLEGCIDCHGDQQKFCSQCHAYAGVKLDCFECHASRPEKK